MVLSVGAKANVEIFVWNHCLRRVTYLCGQKKGIMSTEKKRTINGFEMLLLGVALFILLSIGMQKCGVKVVNKKEDTQIIHKPHQ